MNAENTATMIRIHMTTDCDHVKKYSELLGDTISIMDCMDYRTSRVFSDDIRLGLSLPCLVPSAVMNAAWMEAGMLSKSIAKKAGSNDNEFIFDDDH
jgi:hypothetical protein